MYCIKCGADISPHDYSCPSCGIELNASPLYRIQNMIDHEKDLKQKMDQYSAENVIEATKPEEVDTLEMDSVATPVGEFPVRQGPANTKEAVMVTDLSDNKFFNNGNDQNNFWGS